MIQVLKKGITGLVLLCLIPNISSAQKGYEQTTLVNTFNIILIKNLVLVEAEVAGKIGYFLLDTGASHLTLNNQHFNPNGKNTISGHFSDAHHQNLPSSWIKVQQFRLGDLSRTNFFTPTADLNIFEKILQIELLGLIGMDVIRDYQIVIDYDKQQFSLLKLDKKGIPLSNNYRSPTDYTIDITVSGHLPVLRAQIGSKKNLKLALDTGASVNLINSALKRKIEEEISVLKSVKIADTNNQIQTTEAAIINHITLSDKIILHNWEATFSNINHLNIQPIQIDGLVGAKLLKDKVIALNMKQKKLFLWKNEERTFANQKW